MGGDGSLRHQGAIIHHTSQCSFTLTLYSLDQVTVTLSVSFPHLKKGTCEGFESSSRVQPCPLCMLSSPLLLDLHHTNINSSLSGPPSSSFFDFFFQPPLSFSRGRKYLFGFGFCARLSLSPSHPLLLSLSTGIRTTVFFSSYFLFNYCYFS